MLALGQYEAKVCECGFHESLTNDPANHFTFEDRTCPICRGAARYDRMLGRGDDRLRKQRGADSVVDPSDGRRTFIKQMTTDEVEQRKGGRRGDKA